MTFVGPGFDRFDDFVIPGSQREQAQASPQRTAGVFLQPVTGDLRFDKQIVGHVVIECLDDPIPITVTVRKGLPLGEQGVFVRIARYVQPEPSPALPVMG